MSDFWATREGMQLRPFGAESASVFAKIPFGKVVRVDVKQPRNGAHHRLYWTLCNRIADGVGCESEDISHILKLRTGHVRIVKTKKGLEEVPRSISFASMDQMQFRSFFDKCVVVIETEFGIAKPDILELVKDLLHPQEAA